MRTLQLEWARWVLVICNALWSLGIACLMVLAWFGGREHFVGPSTLSYTVVPLAGLSALFGTLAYQQSKKRGRVLQTVITAGLLGLAAILNLWVLAPYAVFALATVWWLGDFEDAAPRLPDGNPTHVARFMWRRGDSVENIRAMLTTRGVAADEIEKLIYEFVSSEEDRQRMSPGR